MNLNKLASYHMVEQATDNLNLLLASASERRHVGHGITKSERQALSLAAEELQMTKTKYARTKKWLASHK